MGNQREYNEWGGFSEYLYKTVGEPIQGPNGLVGKVVMLYDDEGYHSSLPLYSNTSSIYLKLDDDKMDHFEQMRIYVDRMPSLDFDWNHKHGKYPKGTVHVHEWEFDEKGKPHRKAPRLMTPAEAALYGPFIKQLDPTAQLGV